MRDLSYYYHSHVLCRIRQGNQLASSASCGRCASTLREPVRVPEISPSAKRVFGRQIWQSARLSGGAANRPENPLGFVMESINIPPKNESMQPMSPFLLFPLRRATDERELVLCSGMYEFSGSFNGRQRSRSGGLGSLRLLSRYFSWISGHGDPAITVTLFRLHSNNGPTPYVYHRVFAMMHLKSARPRKRSDFLFCVSCDTWRALASRPSTASLMTPAAQPPGGPLLMRGANHATRRLPSACILWCLCHHYQVILLIALIVQLGRLPVCAAPKLHTRLCDSLRRRGLPVFPPRAVIL